MASRIYLDNAATAPLRPEVLEAMLPWMGLAEDGSYGNASTLSVEGKRARQALEAARASIAEAIGASPPEIIFTSGGTESNNSLIAGLTAGVRQKYGRDKSGNLVVTSAFEHHAILEPVHNLHSSGWQTELLKPTRNGLIEPELLAAAIQEAKPAAQAEKPTACSLVSIMTVNNEIGTVQPLAKLAEIAHASGALFHTDAVQALGKLPFDVRASAVDAASFSAHKLGGPKGVGAFFLRSLTPFKPFLQGGKQERGLRSGTANVAGAVGMARALQLALAEQAAEHSR
ncbi:MAG: cysteine desulfurase, partial [Coriobacteriales bacterium]|nr:cysteine desulfurase [Coriobacteriales bacterium]